MGDHLAEFFECVNKHVLNEKPNMHQEESEEARDSSGDEEWVLEQPRELNGNLAQDEWDLAEKPPTL